MESVNRVETYVPPTETGPKDIPAADAAKLAEQAKAGVTRVTASPSEAAPAEAPKAEQKPADRPAGLPEKFKSIEDMAKAYAELEKKLGSPKPAAEAPKADAPKNPLEALKLPDGKPAEAAPEATPEAAAKAVADAGLDMKALNAEFAQHGDISPESYKALEAKGISKEIVQGYIAGQVALAEKMTADLYSVAGSEEKFQAMHEWSATHLSDAEKDAVNKTIASGDHNAIKLAFAGIHAKYVAAEGNPPAFQLGGHQGHTTADVYTNRAEMLADLKNPDYKRHDAIGEAFRSKVDAKLRRSAI